MGFNFVRIFAHFELAGNIPDRSALFLLSRGGWQNAFRRSMSCSRTCCDSCSVLDCPAHHAFSQVLTSDPAALRRFQKPSSPFIFNIPLLPEMPNKHTRCSVCLTLVGNAVNHGSAYLDALRMLFARGELPLIFLGFEAGGYGAERYQLSPNASMVILSDEGVLQSRVLSPHELSMEFISPVRLLREGRPARVLSPSLVLRSLMRRISSLAFYYGGMELAVDFKWLARQSDSIISKDGTLRWEDRGPGISGLIGRMVLAGDLSDFHYFLAMGEYLNLGKGAAYGCGNYILRD